MYPRAQFLFFLFISIRAHHASACLLFYSIHLACSCSPIPLIQSQLYLSPSCLLTLLPCTSHWSPFLLQRPSPTSSSTYFPFHLLSSSSLFSPLPQASPGVPALNPPSSARSHPSFPSGCNGTSSEKVKGKSVLALHSAGVGRD